MREEYAYVQGKIAVRVNFTNTFAPLIKVYCTYVPCFSSRWEDIPPPTHSSPSPFLSLLPLFLPPSLTPLSSFVVPAGLYLTWSLMEEGDTRGVDDVTSPL